MRRRPEAWSASRPILAAVAGVVLVAFTGSCFWFMRRVPPGCADPRTLALVREVLTDRYHLSQTVALDPVRTLAGGILAVRFVCEAGFGNLDRATLPPGPVPRAVRYTSAVVDNHHHVVVSLTPELIWERAQ